VPNGCPDCEVYKHNAEQMKKRWERYMRDERHKLASQFAVAMVTSGARLVSKIVKESFAMADAFLEEASKE
jgi:hypothetical protein